MFEGLCIGIPVYPPRETFAKRLRVCLESIKQQSYPHIDIVIALARTERLAGNTQLWWKLAFDYGVTMVFWDQPLNDWHPAFMRNLAGRWSRRKCVTFVDVDAVLHPEWAKESMQVIEDENYGCAVTCKTKMTRYPWRSKEYLEMTKSRASFEALVSAAGGNIAPGTGCGTITTTEMYEYLGGLEEDFVGYGATDIDFTSRLELANVEIVDLTEETGILLAHQHHSRELQDAPNDKVPCKVRSLEIMRSKLERGELRRNSNGWGGLVCR